jgi:hypothetical protein
MIKQTVAYTPQAKNYIVFLKLSHKFGVQTEYKWLKFCFAINNSNSLINVRIDLATYFTAA